jgi:hypothetical protein
LPKLSIFTGTGIISEFIEPFKNKLKNGTALAQKVETVLLPKF